MEDGVTGEVMPMEELFRRPATCSAARLAGCRNFFCAEARESGVYLPEWNCTLPLPVDGRTFTTLAVPDGAAIPGDALCCAIVRRIADVEHEIFLLRPLDAPEGAPPLYLELPWGAVDREEKTLSLTLKPERLLLL